MARAVRFSKAPERNNVKGIPQRHVKKSSTMARVVRFPEASEPNIAIDIPLSNGKKSSTMTRAASESNVITDIPHRHGKESSSMARSASEPNVATDISHRQKKKASPLARKVRFSQASELIIFERHAGWVGSNFWYSEIDIEGMKFARKLFVIETRRKLSSLLTRGGRVDLLMKFDPKKVDICGLENFLTSKLNKKVVACRDRRLRAVMEEQARQNDRNEHNPDRLAEVSHLFSEWAMERARSVGSLQSSY